MSLGFRRRVVSSVLVLLVFVAALIEGGREPTKINIVEGTPTKTTTGTAASSHHGYRRYGHQQASGSASSDPDPSKACPPGSVLRVDFNAGTNGDGRLYANSQAGGAFAVQENDRFEYSIMWDKPDCNCTVDFESGIDYRLRDHGPLDSNGISPHAERNSNMSSFAHGKWYQRSWNISHLSGKYIDKFTFAAAIPKNTERIAYFQYIRVVDADGAPRRIVFETGAEPPPARAYMSGTVDTSCQSLAALSAKARLHPHRLVTSPRSPLRQRPGFKALSGGVLLEGTTGIVSGEVTSRTLLQSILGHEGDTPTGASNMGDGGPPKVCPAIEEEEELHEKKEKEQKDDEKLSRQNPEEETHSKRKGNETDDEKKDEGEAEKNEEEEKEKRRKKSPPFTAVPSHPLDFFRRYSLGSSSREGILVHSYHLCVRHNEANDLVLWNIYNQTMETPQWTPMPFWIPFSVPSATGPLTHLLNRSTLELSLRYSIPPSSTITETPAWSVPLTLLEAPSPQAKE